MILNQFRADPSYLRILIASTPKTGNTWLQNLLQAVYHLPAFDLPGDQKWDPDSVEKLGPSWVCRQHFHPTEELLEAIIRHKITVISTVRHPGDTLVSYINYLSWWREADMMPEHQLLARDGGEYKANTHQFTCRYFPTIYALSKAWIALGAFPVRYEDLLADPIAALRGLCGRIAPVHERKIHRAVLLCEANTLKNSGNVDPRFIHSASTHQWTSGLPKEAVAFLKDTEPFVTMRREFGYDWDAVSPAAARFDYTSIDPFGGATHFDNGVEITAALKKIYLDQYAPDGGSGPAPSATGPGSFWTWLNAPAESPLPLDPRWRGLVTNLLFSIYQMRDDLRLMFPDPWETGATGLAGWFCFSGCKQMNIPWALVAPVQSVLEAHLIGKYRPDATAALPAADLVTGEIGTGTDRTSLLGATVAAKSGDKIQLHLNYRLTTRPHQAIIGFILRKPDGQNAFGTNTLMLDQPVSCRDDLSIHCSIRTRLDLPPGDYHVCVGLADKSAAGTVSPLLRLYDIARVQVRGTPMVGGAYCRTTISTSA